MNELCMMRDDLKFGMCQCCGGGNRKNQKAVGWVCVRGRLCTASARLKISKTSRFYERRQDGGIEYIWAARTPQPSPCTHHRKGRGSRRGVWIERYEQGLWGTMVWQRMHMCATRSWPGHSALSVLVCSHCMSCRSSSATPPVRLAAWPPSVCSGTCGTQRESSHSHHAVYPSKIEAQRVCATCMQPLTKYSARPRRLQLVAFRLGGKRLWRCIRHPSANQQLGESTLP